MTEMITLIIIDGTVVPTVMIRQQAADDLR